MLLSCAARGCSMCRAAYCGASALALCKRCSNSLFLLGCCSRQRSERRLRMQQAAMNPANLLSKAS